MVVNFTCHEQVFVEFRECFLLEAVKVNLLCEIAVLVQQTNSDYGHIEVGGRFQKVPGKYA